MKLKKVYYIAIPISEEEYVTEEGAVTKAVDDLAEKMEFEPILIESKEIEQEQEARHEYDAMVFR